MKAMLRMKHTLAILATALTVGTLAACSDSTSADTGRISIKLTDAPGDFQKAVVTIEERSIIAIQGLT